MNTTGIGHYGELAACRYLCDKGYNIVDRNYKCVIAEIDIVAYNSNGVLCFCEVKTRKSKQYGCAYEAVNADKMHQLRKGAISFVTHHGLDCEMQIDVIEVYGDFLNGKFEVFQIEHYENVF